MKFASLFIIGAAALRMKEIPANLVEIKEGDKKDATCERGDIATVAYKGSLKSNGFVFDQKDAF